MNFLLDIIGLDIFRRYLYAYVWYAIRNVGLELQENVIKNWMRLVNCFQFKSLCLSIYEDKLSLFV